jgi:glycosyltransferase involved in cell wall biosynthesis
VKWFFFCYWYEPDALHDPVGLVRMWTLADALTSVGEGVTLFPPRYRSALARQICTVVPIRLIHLPLIRPLSYALLSFVRALVEALHTRPDIVYYRWMASPHALLFAKLLGVPCICEVNGEPVPEWPEHKRSRTHKLKHVLAGAALTRCDRIVVLTEGLKALLHQRYGVSNRRILVLPSGTNTQQFSPRNAVACRLALGLLPDRPYVGFVGSFYRYQGLACLLDAMAFVKQICPAVQLLCVGDGEAAEELKQQAKKLRLESSVTWTGRVPYREVPAWIGAMNVCVAPFRGDRGETSPVKLFDYLACHRPVVVSAIPSVTSVFTSDSGVQFVSPDDPRMLADSLVALLRDPVRCQMLGEQGRRFVERKFSWTTIVEQLRQWLDQDLDTIHHAHSHVL